MTWFQTILVLIIFAFLIGNLEGHIEGPHPWAGKLPTKRYKNKLTDIIFDGKDITGYHLWLFSTLLLIFHYHFLLVTPWTIKNELLTLSAYFLFMVIEDFFAIICNPYFGIKKFSRKYVTWHIHWTGRIPHSYFHGLIASLGLYLLTIALP